MEQIRYHPLIDCDVNGIEKVPLFFGTDEETVAKTHDFYLEETVPKYYRLVAVAPQGHRAYKIHCPMCGNIMSAVSKPINEHKLSIFTCPKCK
jgi:hypothetical protein